MAARMQQKHGTAAQWTAANPVLADGEIGFIKDTKTIKFGDGVTAWNSLPAFTVAMATDSQMLDGLDSTAFLRSNAKAVDADKLDGYDSSNNSVANTVAVRNAAGQLVVATPTTAFHAATKDYVDTRAVVQFDTFTSAGVYTLPTGAKAVEVICIGGGGGGGYSKGGNGGGRATITIPASLISATVPITVGAGGPGSATNSAPVAGMVGTSSSFGTWLTATGGGITAGGGAQYATAGEGMGAIGGAGSGLSGGEAPLAGGGGGGASARGGYSGSLAGGAANTPGASRSGSGLGGSGGGGGSALGVGGIPGGAGGSGDGGNANGVSGAAGARGEVIVITYK